MAQIAGFLFSLPLCDFSEVAIVAISTLSHTTTPSGRSLHCFNQPLMWKWILTRRTLKSSFLWCLLYSTFLSVHVSLPLRFIMEISLLHINWSQVWLSSLVGYNCSTLFLFFIISCCLSPICDSAPFIKLNFMLLSLMSLMSRRLVEKIWGINFAVDESVSEARWWKGFS